jgi:hypothetical protein
MDHAVPDDQCWRAAMEPSFWQRILEQRATLLMQTVNRFRMMHPNDRNRGAVPASRTAALR